MTTPTDFEAFWTPERVTKLRDMAADGKSDFQLADFFGKGKWAIEYARRRFGIEAGYKLVPQKTPVPDDFALIAPTMGREECARHYGTSPMTARRWYRETGIAAAKRVYVRAEKPRKANVVAIHHRQALMPQRDPTMAGRAQSFLQREGPVFRATTVDPSASPALWIVHGRRMQVEDMIAKAEARGMEVRCYG